MIFIVFKNKLITAAGSYIKQLMKIRIQIKFFNLIYIKERNTIYKNMYMYMCVCMCVCVCAKLI